MSDPSHREFMRNLNMQWDTKWAEIREQVKEKTWEQLTHSERYLVIREGRRQIEKATTLDVGQHGPTTLHPILAVIHEFNALLGGYRQKPDPLLDQTKVVQAAEAVLNGLFNYSDSDINSKEQGTP